MQQIDVIQTKVCSKCCAPKPTSSFHKDNSKKGGLRHRCIECNRTYQKMYNVKNEAKQKASRRAYRSKHAEAQRSRARTYNITHATKVKEQRLAYYAVPKNRYARLLSCAADAGMSVSITAEEYVSIISIAKCHYCDGSLAPTGYGLDRKDNSIGYVVSNVVPCCRYCNMVKSDKLSYEEMLEVGSLFKMQRARRIDISDEVAPVRPGR